MDIYRRNEGYQPKDRTNALPCGDMEDQEAGLYRLVFELQIVDALYRYVHSPMHNVWLYIDKLDLHVDILDNTRLEIGRG